MKAATLAKQTGASRFCMGAAWRNPPAKDFLQVLAIVSAVKTLGLETCMTLGSLTEEQASALKSAGLDFYNHNIDTSPEFYKTIITTHTFDDRLTTISEIGKANIRLCCGGILGMGETREDRIQFLLALAHLPTPPESIPINRLIPVPGTPLASAAPLEFFEFVRTIAIARLMFPEARIRLSAGREAFSEEQQAWCFMAGANSIFYGEKLLTANNSNQTQDQRLFKKLGLKPLALTAPALCY
jgi:biotin synthase